MTTFFAHDHTLLYLATLSTWPHLFCTWPQHMCLYMATEFVLYIAANSVLYMATCCVHGHCVWAHDHTLFCALPHLLICTWSQHVLHHYLHWFDRVCLSFDVVHLCDGSCGRIGCQFCKIHIVAICWLCCIGHCAIICNGLAECDDYPMYCVCVAGRVVASTVNFVRYTSLRIVDCVALGIVQVFALVWPIVMIVRLMHMCDGSCGRIHCHLL